jgi:hypothetical protein
MARAQVVRLTGPVILEWDDGTRIQLSPAGLAAEKPAKAPAARKPKGRPGRKPSPATQTVIDAMEADHAAGTQQSRPAYLEILRGAGYDGSDAAAGQILAREATRIFGKTLGRAPATNKARKRVAKRAAQADAGGTAGRKPSRPTALVRGKIAKDAAGDGLKDATHYVRWLVQQEGVKIGLKGARPIVYRELRKARA